jgi:beta-phosphoglucomutase-like phosphatase (HAD superfamily)
MIAFLRRLTGSDPRSRRVDQEHDKQAALLEEQSRAFEGLEERLEKLKQRTARRREGTERVVETMRPSGVALVAAIAGAPFREKLDSAT